MTLNYGIFDSADPASPDRTYTATLLSRIAGKCLSNGVVPGDLNELRITVAYPPAMKIVVSTGTAIINGRFCENDTAFPLNITAANASNPRIDRVVVRLSAVTNRTIDIVVKAGTPASSPAAPALTRTSDVYEVSLASIAVGAGVSSIITANITDERGDPSVCGYTYSHGSQSFPGDISMSATATIPPWKLLCDGTSYSTTKYPNLFAAIGYKYGGSGAIFKVPNLIGKVAVGVDSTGTDPDYLLGVTGGAEDVTLTTDQMPAHKHNVALTAAPDHTHTFTAAQTTSYFLNSGTGGQMCSNAGGTTSAAGGHNHTVSEDTIGGGLAHENRMPYMSLYYVIQI